MLLNQLIQVLEKLQKGTFPNEGTLYKLFCLIIKEFNNNWLDENIRNWPRVLN